MGDYVWGVVAREYSFQDVNFPHIKQSLQKAVSWLPRGQVM